MTQNEAIALGAITGGMIGTFATVLLIIYVLLIIANWKIFTKAGEKGWKSIIPIYNVYIAYKIAGMKKWFWISLLVGIVQAIIAAIVQNNETLTTIVAVVGAIFDLCVAVVFCYRLSKAFGHGMGYTLGLIFLPNIFTLILGFGSSEYVGIEE